MDPMVLAKIEEIRKRAEEFRLHENDAYAYVEEEIDAVRDLKTNAIGDIEFLLAQLDAKA